MSTYKEQDWQPRFPASRRTARLYSTVCKLELQEQRRSLKQLEIDTRFAKLSQSNNRFWIDSNIYKRQNKLPAHLQKVEGNDVKYHVVRYYFTDERLYLNMVFWEKTEDLKLTFGAIRYANFLSRKLMVS